MPRNRMIDYRGLHEATKAGAPPLAAPSLGTFFVPFDGNVWTLLTTVDPLTFEINMN
jgi:hypothetical protein